MLEIRNLSSGYGDALVLRDFSCRFENGRVTALMGRNGMGKTTLLKTIMGLIKAKGGSVLFDGQTLETWPTHLIARAGIGYVPQGREIFEDFSVEENLQLGLMGRDATDALPFSQIYDWFPLLKKRKDQRAGTFSGGQQQILAIARALIGGPKMLLLDEPTEGIQPSIVHDIGLQLARIAKETGLGILIVEQNVEMVRTLADQVLFMENGEIRESCDIEAIKRNDSLLHRYLSV
ncbi:ABC transporter ATP-binding protein [uncultured Sneathiella sp.]|jgi:branched-chain amino acid transport system ATP-binding protein/urea transport system ATP-binding protein|uniref:ABC transporter ATP-binding protein n=1 Tax=uncultured Sneathiella sp. TaxID=879315 RepID=UPI0030D7344E|tara:strand:+ start:404 stop:1105 length:702 start_codon:yes stop_codon:yes gene_type:complete